MNRFTHRSHELAFVLVHPVLEELLYDVVAEDVGHERQGPREDLREDLLLLRRRRLLQLLLDEPGAVLVLAELHHVPGQLGEGQVGEAVVPEMTIEGLVLLSGRDISSGRNKRKQ